MGTNVWSYAVVEPVEVDGFRVEAADGHIGKVDEATYDVGSSYVVVDTGPWILGRKVLIPAGAVEAIDLDEATVKVGLTKDQIKDSPEYDAETFRSDEYRTSVGDYYEPYIRL